MADQAPADESCPLARQAIATMVEAMPPEARRLLLEELIQKHLKEVGALRIEGFENHPAVLVHDPRGGRGPRYAWLCRSKAFSVGIFHGEEPWAERFEGWEDSPELRAGWEFAQEKGFPAAPLAGWQ